MIMITLALLHLLSMPRIIAQLASSALAAHIEISLSLQVADLSHLQSLAQLPELSVLWLSDNPCAQTTTYRKTVIAKLPSLQKLDNQEISDKERRECQSAVAAEAKRSQAADNSTSKPPPPPVQVTRGEGTRAQVPDPPVTLSPHAHSLQPVARPVPELPPPSDAFRRSSRSSGGAALEEASAPSKGRAHSTPAPGPSPEVGGTHRKNLLVAVMALVDEMAALGDKASMCKVQQELQMRLAAMGS